jgi:membrane-bound ClpP family serine protease
MRLLAVTDYRSTGRQDAEGGAVQEALSILEPLEVAYPLVAFGLLGVVVWLAIPAAVWSCGVGVIALAAGVAGMAAGQISAGAVLFLLMAAGALAMEVLAFPGFGLHAAGGGVGLLMAGLFWTEQPVGPYAAVVAAVAAVVAGLTYRAGRRSWRRIRDEPFERSSELTGRRAVVLAGRGSLGHGVVDGELWQLRARSVALREAQAVEVVAQADDWLVVRQLTGRDRRSEP